ncbi:MAG: hypothetical protein QG644_405 [Patescibacteria group bacterium]|nr:hypothetical protein [Patescibacteria group bacterium]
MEKNFNDKEQFSVSVNVATPADLEDYKNIRLEALREYPEAFGRKLENEINKTEKEWEEELSNQAEPVFLAKESKKTIGMASTFESPNEKDTWTIISLYVSNKFQGKDVGKNILRAVEEEIRKRGAKKAILYVDDKNTANQGFYARQGYVLDPFGKYEKWERMEKVIPA